MRSSLFLRVAVLAVLASSACGDDDKSEDEPTGQKRVDAGVDVSTSKRDASASDASRDTRADASEGNKADAATLPGDGGALDAAQTDAEEPDAAELDAAQLDAAEPDADLDAAIADAPDASDDSADAVVPDATADDAAAGEDAGDAAAAADAATDAGSLSCNVAGNCPGFQAANLNVYCVQSQCLYSCQGEAYDLDGDPKNGCEVLDAPQGNHVSTKAAASGTPSTCAPATFTAQGRLPSDARVHEAPAVEGFDARYGYAPDFISYAPKTSLLCASEVVATLTVTGAANPACYALRANINAKVSQQCQADSTGKCTIRRTNNVQFDNTGVVFQVSKTCGTLVAENPRYTITGNF